MDSTLTGDEIVISGMAGRFPNSANVNELRSNLLNKIDCVGDCKARWNYEHSQIPPRIGTMKALDTFDNVFFGVNGLLAEYLEPMVKIFMEIIYEAITDAGINPRKLKGSKTAIFTGNSLSESEKTFFYEKCPKLCQEKCLANDKIILQINGYSLQGLVRSMLANRSSFYFDLTGPSHNFDSNCCSGATALQAGFMAIKSGRVESAIIGASNIILHPHTSLQELLLGLLSPDGITKTFDNKADGYTRSEAIVVYFLQKARDAKRIYAEVKNIQTGFTNVCNDQFLQYPKCDSQVELMRRTLKESGLSGKDISFVEADGSGIKDVDAEEVKAIDEVYNEGRKSPLYIGSIKSNIGACSSANALNGIMKIITAMESGYISPNLHFDTPSDKIPALKEGRCKVVTELTPWTGDYAVVNNLAFSGGCSNIILKDFKKEKKNMGKPDDSLSRLVIASGRTKETVDYLLNDLENRPVDVEMLQLLYDIFETETSNHLYRGYTLLPPTGLPKTKLRNIQHYVSGEKREVWYMFSGMGSQWVGMGKALLQIPVFEKAIKKCDKVLKPRGIDIVHIITDSNPKMFDNIVNSFVGIAAIQVGLVDVLESVGLKPDFLIGHSVGELGCAYADGCITAEQMVLSSLSRGLASVETKMPRGSMAAVGLGYEELKNLCPPDIDVACHNSSTNSTISGPEESMKTFVAQLQKKKIFAKEVSVSNIAYHSRYIAPVGAKLRNYLDVIISDAKPRSKRWLSSSVPQDEWDSPKAQLSSAEYHTNNLLNSVLFAEAAKLIPPKAIVIEIAPHGLLQAIVRRSLPEEVINVPLTRRDHSDNVLFLFEALGKIYNAGCTVNVSNLYPKVSYPVSRGTPSISPLIQWDHSVKWTSRTNSQAGLIKLGQMNFIVNLTNDKWKYLNNHRIYSTTVIPTSLYLKLAWDVLNSFQTNPESSVSYTDVITHNQLILPFDENIELITMVQKGSGFFQITKDDILLCSGTVQMTAKKNKNPTYVNNDAMNHENLSSNGVYTELKMRGYEYSGPFRSIRKISTNGSSGILDWKENWTTFLDGMLQMYVLGNDTRKAQVPFKIKNIFIDTKLHEEIINKTSEVPVTVHRILGNIRAGGVEIEGIILESCEIRRNRQNILTEEISPGTIVGTFEHLPLGFKLQLVSNWKAGQLNDFDLNSISWIEDPPTKVGNKIKVEYSSVNEEDILLAKTNISLEDHEGNRLETKLFGQEYSGIDSQGNRLMGIVRNTALSNYITPDNDFTWKIPDNWSMEDAATVPLAYATAYSALMIKGELQTKEKIFIYNGACSNGQAIVNLALDITSQVFVGLIDDNDKEKLKNIFPNIPEEHYISGSQCFADQLLARTEGKGVDLLVYNGNDLSQVETCMYCMKKTGKVIVVENVKDTFLKSCQSDKVGLRNFLSEIYLFSLVPMEIINHDRAIKIKVAKLIQEGLANQTVRPLPRLVYSRERLNDAFSDRTSKGSFQKILVKVQPEDKSNKALTIPRFLCKSEASYLILEGFGDFGLELVNFLVDRGAKNIVIASELKNTGSFSKHRINFWKRSGVLVTVREELDFTNLQNIKSLLEIVNTLGTVDAIFDLQRLDNSSKRSSKSKYLFTNHLFEESKKMCPYLQQFLVFLTKKHIGESVDDTLSEDFDLTQLVLQKTNRFSGLLILLGPISGFEEKTTENEKNVPLLSIPDIIEQMDKITMSNASIVSIYHKLLNNDFEKNTKEIVVIEESEREKFEKYIKTPLTIAPNWRHQIPEEYF
ncbi:fatty acid synthase-like [Leptopilina heterotoma]|uniref:fatty acid synthase-like n=1 Tax=Leptopilina heterotoma TaxID=63436 RepID=UPI001CA93682|nr:fatty acid synthase-like [Leptopilina heterotoma]